MSEFRICVIGNFLVGKTCIIDRLKSDCFDHDVQTNTSAGESTITTVNYQGTNYKLCIWDTPEITKLFRSMAKIDCGEANVAIIVYDITDMSSFKDLDYWIKKVKELGRNTICAIVANKYDLKDTRKVSKFEGQDYAERVGAIFAEVSAKTGHNIEYLSAEIIYQLAKEKDLRPQKQLHPVACNLPQEEIIREFKVCVVGNDYVGKSCFVQRFLYDKYVPMYHNIASLFDKKAIRNEDELYKLNIWDVKVTDRFRKLLAMYYRRTDAAIIVYDITEMSSFKEADDYWFKQVQSVNDENVVYAIVGSKCDLADHREVSTEEGRQYAESIGAFFTEVSAKTGQNVHYLFSEILDRLIKVNILAMKNDQHPIDYHSQQQKTSRRCKICVTGRAAVGKTSIVDRFIDDESKIRTQPLTRYRFFSSIVANEGKYYHLHIWDMTGEDHLEGIAASKYRKANVAVIVYDITDMSSFKELDYWVKLVKSVQQNIIYAIVGNKCDLKYKREVSTEEGRRYAESIGAIFAEVSAKTAYNLDNLRTEVLVRFFKDLQSAYVDVPQKRNCCIM